MKKMQMGPAPLLYPMPVMLVGAMVDGRPNFMTAVWGGIANQTPPMLSVAVRESRQTMRGIRQERAFSVNVPPASLVAEVDYCGIVSGSSEDKVRTCGFDIFFGRLGEAPLISQCPLCLECRVERTIELGTHVLVLGEIMESHVSEACVTDGLPDPVKMDPLLYLSGVAKCYARLGEIVGPAFSAGLRLKKGDG